METRAISEWFDGLGEEALQREECLVELARLLIGPDGPGPWRRAVFKQVAMSLPAEERAAVEHWCEVLSAEAAAPDAGASGTR